MSCPCPPPLPLLCTLASKDTTCKPINVARACGEFGGECVGLTNYPNATIADYGSISGADAMMKEPLLGGKRDMENHREGLRLPSFPEAVSDM